MFGLIYTGFFFILVLEVLLFLFLNLPMPKGWKGRAISLIKQNKNLGTVVKIHLGCCLLSGLFLVDCFNQESSFRKDKKALKKKDSMASELKSSFLSFMILKVQRNKYITFMLIYTSLALSIYLWMLLYMYEKREYMQAQNPLIFADAAKMRLSYG